MQISPCKYKTDSQSGDGPLQRVQGKEGQKHHINFHEDTNRKSCFYKYESAAGSVSARAAEFK